MLRTRGSVKALVNGRPVFFRNIPQVAPTKETPVTPPPVVVEAPAPTQRQPFSKPVKKVEPRKPAPIVQEAPKVTKPAKKDAKPKGKRAKTSKKK